MGFIGGRPNHAIWFVGHRGDTLLGLDPHTTQQALPPSDTSAATAPGAGANVVSSASNAGGGAGSGAAVAAAKKEKKDENGVPKTLYRATTAAAAAASAATDTTTADAGASAPANSILAAGEDEDEDEDEDEAATRSLAAAGDSAQRQFAARLPLTDSYLESCHLFSAAAHVKRSARRQVSLPKGWRVKRTILAK